MHDTAIGLREAKKRATRTALHEAAVELTLEHGLDEVTVEQICARAGVSVRTFFNYFESKDRALLGPKPALAESPAAGTFLAGGPTGDLVRDALHLVGSVIMSEVPDRENGQKMNQLVLAEPRVLAARMARFTAFEAELTALIRQRVPMPAPEPGSYVGPAEVAAAITFTVVRLASLEWFHSTAAPQTIPDLLRLQHRRLLGLLDPARRPAREPDPAQ